VITWHRSIGSGRFAFVNGHKVTQVWSTGMTLVESVTDGMPDGRVSSWHALVSDALAVAGVSA
jgi:hypothetical protein